MEIEPLYPDLIKEYMFCFYMDDSRLSEVLNELWQNEASKFAIFITRALTDFPEISFFKKVLKEFDENTQNIDVLLGRLNLLQKRTVDENDDPMVLISIIDNEYAFWRQVKIPEENTQKEKLATTKVMGLNMVAQQYAGWSLYDLSYMMEALDEMCKVQGGEATNVLKQLFLSEAIKGLSQKGFVEESNSLIQKMNEIIGENPEMDELSSISEMDCYNAEMMNDLQLEKFDDALNVLKTMRSKCNYENINAVRILMLSHRNIIEMAFQMGKKDVIAKVMADAKMLSEKYLNDVDVQAKWMLCRLCDLEERFFDKGETISLDEVSEIKIEVPLNSYEKNNEASEYLGMLWGATNTFKLNFVNKDKEEQPLDTNLVKTYLNNVNALNLGTYVTYNTTDEELAKYGLDEPQYNLEVKYTPKSEDSSEDSGDSTDSEAGSSEKTFILHVSAKQDDKAYVRIGDSKIIYEITEDEYKNVTDGSYDSLRHKSVVTADLSDVDSVKVTLEDKDYTIDLSEKKGDVVSTYDGEEIEGTDFTDALKALKASDFTSEEPSEKEEISFTLHYKDDKYPEKEVKIYRYDGTNCLVTIDGKSISLVKRDLVVDLTEAVNAIVLK